MCLFFNYSKRSKPKRTCFGRPGGTSENKHCQQEKQKCRHPISCSGGGTSAEHACENWSNACLSLKNNDSPTAGMTACYYGQALE